MRNFSEIATPLNRLLEKGKEVQWNEECEEAFQCLKERLLKEPVVAHPDFSRPFKLYTDASNVGLGAVLAQVQGGRERIICCASRSLNKAEWNYTTTKKECLAIVWGIKTFRGYLMPSRFEVFTDHQCLQWLRSMQNEDALLYRWAAYLEAYDYEIKHRPGSKQGHVDGLSRLPVMTLKMEGGKPQLSEEETKAVLQKIHKDGHLGIKKMMKIFNKRYNGVRAYVQGERITQECHGCQTGKDYRPRKLPSGHINSQQPWDLVSIDVVSPLPRNKAGQRFILLILDCFSRYVILVPLEDHTAETVSKALM